MYYTYVLANNQNRLYIGITNSLERRLQEHFKGYHRSTKSYRPYRLVFSKGFPDRKEARRYEKYLKTTNGRRWLKNYFIAG